jgi:hypothetical protein
MSRILHSRIEPDVNIKENFLSQNQYIPFTPFGIPPGAPYGTGRAIARPVP